MAVRDLATSPVRWGPRLQQTPRWLLMLLVAALLVGCWTLVYATGGTRTAFPHVFYIPIVLAALPFGMRGGLVAGFVAMLLCGPAMPLDVATGEPQELANWLMRGGFFIAIGGLSGTTASTLRRGFAADLADQLWDEIEAASPRDMYSFDAAWTARITDTLGEGSFRVVFQPIYALVDGRLVAVEALTRFEGSTYPPDVWFAQAHRAGMGVQLELATLAAALNGSERLDDDIALSFNASPRLLTDTRLMALLDRHPGRRLIVEVTEHAVIDDYHEIAEALTRLRARGIRVAVDDAGAGFASLRHIVRLQPDVIKLDLSLTQHLGDDPVRRALADALLQFGDRTGSRIVVEGIETVSDLVTWRELGAHAAQGYLLAHPGHLPFPTHDRTLAAWRHTTHERNKPPKRMSDGSRRTAT